jgi:two-component system phosphate regulon response regulator PhoB
MPSLTEPAMKMTAPSESRAQRPHLLIVEDEDDLRELLSHTLARDGFRISSVGSGEAALTQVRKEPPAMVLLDLMLPGIGGLDVCRRIKADPATAAISVVMLTARGEEADIVTGLEMGADDYITKPFSPRILAARLKAVMRRAELSPAGTRADDETIARDDLVIDPQRHEVLLAGERIDLTAMEFRLLTLLAARPGRVFTRQQIIEQLHGAGASVTDRSVDVQVVMLRRKLDDRAKDIETVRGVGYRFRD